MVTIAVPKTELKLVTFVGLMLAGQHPTVALGVGVPAGSASLTGHAPSVQIQHNRQTSAGSLSLAGLAPAVDAGGPVSQDPGAGSLTLAGLAPTLDIPFSFPDAGSLGLSGLAPATQIFVVGDATATPGAGSLSLETKTPAIPIEIDGADSSLLFTGYAPNVAVTVPVDITTRPDAGSIGITGLLPARPTGLFLTGQVPTVTGGGITIEMPSSDDGLPPLEGPTLALTPYAPTVFNTTPGPIVAAGEGALALTGYAPDLDVGAPRPAQGELALTGLQPRLAYSWTVKPEAGSYSLAGYAPVLLPGKIYFPGSATVTISGLVPGTSIVELWQDVDPNTSTWADASATATLWTDITPGSGDWSDV